MAPGDPWQKLTAYSLPSFKKPLNPGFFMARIMSNSVLSILYINWLSFPSYGTTYMAFNSMYKTPVIPFCVSFWFTFLCGFCDCVFIGYYVFCADSCDLECVGSVFLSVFYVCYSIK